MRLQPLRKISTTRRIFELRLKDTDSGRWANFADVGFGIGQVFPVIVEGLRAPQGATFLVEEPEIHLHPDAQLAMGNFLAELAQSGKRIIVETHSEHLLLRLRHLVVGVDGKGRSKTRFDPAEISVVYVEKTARGTSRARRLDVDSLGQIQN